MCWITNERDGNLPAGHSSNAVTGTSRIDRRLKLNCLLFIIQDNTHRLQNSTSLDSVLARDNEPNRTYTT